MITDDFIRLKHILSHELFCDYDVIDLNMDYEKDEEGLAVLNGDGYVIKLFKNGTWDLINL